MIKPDENKDKFLIFGEWNNLKVRVKVDTVSTWLNEDEMVNLKDVKIGEARRKIALQIHDGGDIKVALKNISLIEL
ncbi:family 16 glycoside hydrolase [Aureibaculum marinum]|uniref:family 16 glycoside hydrolase n=1 Tax=Aureibaculum marinum TaxID=2487930 RepID=UPI001EEFA585|nr:family 16 glycoside hydrolase [Aureibaculum marinum]